MDDGQPRRVGRFEEQLVQVRHVGLEEPVTHLVRTSGRQLRGKI